MHMLSEQNLLWLDLEMTGLIPEKHHILQIAAIVTDQTLTVRAEGPEIVIHQPVEHVRGMDGVVLAMHTNSGLLNKVTASHTSIGLAEQEIISFTNQHCISGMTILCGNSIWVDRTFLKQHMPSFERMLHYRMIDVSSVKELVNRWYPDQKPFKKQKQHTARSDIYESIAELKYYREHYFIEKFYSANNSGKKDLF
jgi:oligoribonuclease